MFALVLWMRSRFNTQADFATDADPDRRAGRGDGVLLHPAEDDDALGAAPDRIAAASGLSNFVRITAGAIGTSISTTLWDDRAALHHAHLVEAASLPGAPAQAALEQMVAGGMTRDQALTSLQRLIDQQAYMLGANDIFFASALIFVALIVLVWFARPIKAGAGGGAEASAAH